jgi:hypothetical protein
VWYGTSEASPKSRGSRNERRNVDFIDKFGDLIPFGFPGGGVVFSFFLNTENTVGK